MDAQPLGEKEFTMPQRHRPPYPDEFRRQMVELVRVGRSPEELAEQFEPTAQTIRNWMKQFDLDEGRRQDGLTTAERKEIAELQRENRRLREEREILSKAAAWFAQEADSISTRRSSSSMRTRPNTE
jgi:transposase